MLDDVETVRFQLGSRDELPDAAKTIIEYGKETDIWLFYGEMGAG